MSSLATLSLSKSTKRTIKKRTILLYQGEIPRQGYIVQKGVIKVYRLSRSGDEQIIGFRMPGDIFPETWLFEKTSSALYYYEAMEDCEVLTAERSVIREHIRDNPEIERSLLDYFINSHTSQLLQITALEQSRAADKLLLMLYYLLFHYARQTTPGEYELRFHLTHTTLGNLTGLTRETTSVELGKLRRKGVISYSGASFTIHKGELERYLAQESFSDVQVA
jgi:CRP-like cAMP-binding protein